MKKKLIISEEDYITSEYVISGFEKLGEITRYEHDFEKKQYIIDYKEEHEGN